MLTNQIDNFLPEGIGENTGTMERIGVIEGLDLITLKEKLRKHGVK